MWFSLPLTEGLRCISVPRQVVNLPEPLCVGVTAPQGLNLEKSDLSIAGRGSTLLEWLQAAWVETETLTPTCLLPPFFRPCLLFLSLSTSNCLQPSVTPCLFLEVPLCSPPSASPSLLSPCSPVASSSIRRKPCRGGAPEPPRPRKLTQDVNVSGKFVMLGEFKDDGGSVHLHFSAATAGLHNTFTLSTPLSSLGSGVQLNIAVTQDPTSAESLTIPLVVVSHPPPVQLHLNCSGCFFMPEFSARSPRTEYALCGNTDRVENLWASVEDERFTVVATDSPEALTCTGAGHDVRTEFQVVRAKPCPWCEHYVPRDAGYDLVVRRSISQCLRTALDLEEDQKLKKILQSTRTQSCSAQN